MNPCLTSVLLPCLTSTLNLTMAVLLQVEDEVDDINKEEFEKVDNKLDKGDAT